MVGELEDLQTGLVGFMRLNDARELGDLSEVPLPTRFLILILGPKGSEVHLREMGRCIATMMVDEVGARLRVCVCVCTYMHMEGIVVIIIQMQESFIIRDKCIK